MKRHKIGSLDCIDIFDPKSWDQKRALILLHGFGANCEDLAGLANHLRLKGIRMLFPDGPQTVEIGPHMEGRAWFPISLRELEAETGINFEKLTPPGIKKAREAIMQMVEKAGLDWTNIVIGGFSQGAMLATDVVLNLPVNPLGLVILSGTLVNQDIWEQKAKNHSGLRFFQSHGEQDTVLPAKSAKLLEQTFKSGGLSGELHLFRGGHEIPLEILTRLESFLRKIYF